MASDPSRTVQLSTRTHPNTTPSSSSTSTKPYTLEEIYHGAMLEAEKLHAAGKLSQKYYDILQNTKTPQDLLSVVDAENQRRMEKQSQLGHALCSAVSSVVKKLDRYTGAIDMLAQSSPQSLGVNLVGLIWGSLKLLLVVAQDLSNTFEMAVQIIKDMESSLPVLETLTQIYGSSEIQLLKQPLIAFYMAITSLGLNIMRLCERGPLRTLGRSLWAPLLDDLKGSVAELTRAGQLVHQTAQVEHMCTSDKVWKTVDIESGRQENFRREIRRNIRPPVGHNPRTDIVPCNNAPLGFLAPHFTGRAEDLAKLKIGLGRRSDGMPARFSVVGMPGLGKTQLALKYASQAFDQINGPMILWSSAATVDKLTLGYSEVLNLVDHVDRDHTDQGLKLRTARRYLESAGLEQALPWLLIFDNVNEETVPFLREHLPQTNENVAILFTMRSNDVAKALINPTSLVESQAILYLEVPKLNDAIDLLLAELEVHNGFDTTSHITKAETLVKLVGYLPLAINQVASFAQQYSKDLDYILGVYQGQQHMDIMKWDNQLSTYEQRSVMSAFSSPLDALAKASPVASLLLQTLSFFDPESIPLDMIVAGAYPIRDLRAYSEETEPELLEPPMPKRRLMQKLQHKLPRRLSKAFQVDPIYTSHTVSTLDLKDQCRYDAQALEMSELLEDDIKCSNVIQQLCQQAFVAYHSDTDGQTLRMHDLVRSIVRYNARQSSSDPLCYRMAAAIVQYALYTIRYLRTSSSFLQHEKILPHYRSIASLHDAQKGCNIEVVRASRRVAIYLDRRGRREEAIETIEAILHVQQQFLAKTDIDYLAIVDKLLRLYRRKDPQKAKGLFEQNINDIVASLGATHILTLKFRMASAVVLRDLGNYEEASSLQEEVVSIMKKKTGIDHCPVFLAQHQLAWTYEFSGRFVEAETTLEEVMRTVEETFGTSGCLLSLIVADLGSLRHKLQRLDEADILLSRALAETFGRYGTEHGCMADIVERLGILRLEQGNFMEAEVHLKASLASTKTRFGKEHSQTIRVSGYLAWLYIDTQRFVDAECVLRATGRSVFDQFEHNIELAFAVEQQGRLAEAESFLRLVADKYADQDPITTISFLGAFSRVLYAQEHEDEAKIVHESVLEELKGALKRLYRRGIYNTYFRWHRVVTIGRILDDEETCRIALEVQEEKIGFTHPVTQGTLQALIGILHRTGKVEEEEALVQRCKDAGLELRLPEEAEISEQDRGDNEAESNEEGTSTVKAGKTSSGEAELQAGVETGVA